MVRGGASARCLGPIHLGPDGTRMVLTSFIG